MQYYGMHARTRTERERQHIHAVGGATGDPVRRGPAVGSPSNRMGVPVHKIPLDFSSVQSVIRGGVVLYQSFLAMCDLIAHSFIFSYTNVNTADCF